ncbi:hypothetical protein [Shewanella sp. UCD-KL12]|uniref:hypothetical protein n=1 Tax=Shewanella sp. UCD-KL12 TaxID=1917163 RepID=UPI000970BCC9|nr:hypothetical protein [Shewanella sp. UCD-KL12]
MKAFTLKAFATTLITSTLLVGCASTDPSQPQSSNDFVYNSNMSFAMNVVDGSLGFHKGLQDAKVPEGADASAGALDYAADGIIGAAFGGGISGAFLSMLGTNQGSAPLHTYYNIVYYPVKEKGNIQSIFDSLEQEFITLAESKKQVTFVEKRHSKDSRVLLEFKGKGCELKNELMSYKQSDTCNFIHYNKPELIKYASITPNGNKGLFAVIGYEGFIGSNYLSLDLDEKFYIFSPVIRNRTKFPFVSNNKDIYLFIKPSHENSKRTSSISIETLAEIDPWVKKHYQ